MEFARAIVAAYVHRAMEPAPALALAQITPYQLRDARAAMTSRQMEQLSAAAMQELDDEGLGAYERRLPWGSYGMLARASLSAPDLGTALRRWCRHHGLLTQSVRLTLTQSGDLATVQVSEAAPLPAALRELSLVFVLRNIVGLGSWFIDSRIALRQAAFPFAAPPHAAAYAQLFPGADLGFGAPQTLVRFDGSYLAQPLRRDERALQQMLRQQALHTTVRPYRRDRLLVQQVRQALATHPRVTHNAAGVAALLHVSERTLHRQLAQEGASLQQLKDRVRSERAQELLRRTAQPVKQVAAAVGFENEKSFSRAFRVWTGLAPAQYRLHHAN
jgi:AraC-like DNA-binding protein